MAWETDGEGRSGWNVWPKPAAAAGGGVNRASYSTLDVFLGLKDATAPVSKTWPTANLAYFFPIVVPADGTIRRVFWANGGTAAGNVDCGVYNSAGTLIISSGSTAQSGTTTLQFVDVADTAITAGAHYIALAMSLTTSTMLRFKGTMLTLTTLRAHGVLQQASALPLPATATFATHAGGTTTDQPICGFELVANSVL